MKAAAPHEGRCNLDQSMKTLERSAQRGSRGTPVQLASLQLQRKHVSQPFFSLRWHERAVIAVGVVPCTTAPAMGTAAPDAARKRSARNPAQRLRIQSAPRRARIKSTADGLQPRPGGFLLAARPPHLRSRCTLLGTMGTRAGPRPRPPPGGTRPRCPRGAPARSARTLGRRLRGRCPPGREPRGTRRGREPGPGAAPSRCHGSARGGPGAAVGLDPRALRGERRASPPPAPGAAPPSADTCAGGGSLSARRRSGPQRRASARPRTAPAARAPGPDPGRTKGSRAPAAPPRPARGHAP